MKRLLISLVTKENQIIITMRYHCAPIRQLKQKGQILSVSKDMEQLELSNTGSGSAKWYNHFEELFGSIY